MKNFVPLDLSFHLIFKIQGEIIYLYIYIYINIKLKMAKIISYDYSIVQSSKVEENDGDKFINTRIETRGH